MTDAPVVDTFHLDHDSDIPLHMQFEQQIKQRILDGQWKPHQRIPSERDLMLMAGVSRATVRQTLSSLVREGLLEKSLGRGTFVKPPRYEQPLQNVYSFSAQLRSMGMELKDQVLRCEVIDATPEIAERLALSVSDPVIYLRRLRFLRGTPMMVNIAYIPYAMCPKLVEETFEESLYYLLANKYGYPIIAATDKLEAIAADAATAALLQVPNGTPLMFVERTALTTGNRIIHHGYNYIRGDMCRFRSDMHAPPTALEIKL